MHTCITIICAAVLGCGAGIAAAGDAGTNTDARRKDNSTHRIVSPHRTPTNTDAAGTARNGRETGSVQNRARQTGDPEPAAPRDGNTR